MEERARDIDYFEILPENAMPYLRNLETMATIFFPNLI
jgi:hypothetical protein